MIVIRRINSNVMPRKIFNQIRRGRDRPILDVRRQPIRVSQNKFLVCVACCSKSAAQTSPAMIAASVEGE